MLPSSVPDRTFEEVVEFTADVHDGRRPVPRPVRRILLVDDQEPFRKSLLESLERTLENVEVVCARSGEEAIREVGRNSFSLVLTDLEIPDFDGVELVSEFRSRGYSGSVIVLSGHLDAQRERRALSLGALTCLAKPCDLDDLVSICRAALEELDHGIRGLSVAGVAQLLSLEGKTGMLRANSGERRGDLFFVEGELVNAVTGRLTGEAAALEVLSWAEAELEIHDISLAQPNRVELPLHHLLLEAARLHDEANREAFDSAPQRRTAGLGDRRESTNWGPEQDRNGSNGPLSNKEALVADIKSSLSSLMQIDGVIGVALVDFKSGMTLGTEGGGTRINLDVAGAGNTEVVRSKMRVMEQLGLSDHIEDILITLGAQYHLIRILKSAPELFLYLALDRDRSNLALARHKLAAVEEQLEV